MKSLKVGFIPLIDAAIPIAAHECGFAEAQGLKLELIREVSWANIRDKLILDLLDASHMLAPLAVATSLGIGHIKVPVIAPFALGLGGNAITVSLLLWEQMAQEGALPGGGPASHAAALQRVVAARERGRREPLTFAMVYPFSCHNYELRYWFSSCGLDPDRDARLVVLPPPLLVATVIVAPEGGSGARAPAIAASASLYANCLMFWRYSFVNDCLPDTTCTGPHWTVLEYRRGRIELVFTAL